MGKRMRNVQSKPKSGFFYIPVLTTRTDTSDRVTLYANKTTDSTDSNTNKSKLTGNLRVGGLSNRLACV
jgi:hypothetical protein